MCLTGMSSNLSRVRVSACTRASRTQGDIHGDIQKQGASLSPTLGGPRSRANCHQRSVVAGSIIHREVLKSLVFETAGPGAIRKSPMRNQTHGDTGHLVAASSPMPPMKPLQCIGPAHSTCLGQKVHNQVPPPPSAHADLNFGLELE